MLTLVDVARHHPEAAHCDALYEVRDEVVGLHAFIALHDVSRGPAYGGIRRWRYPSAAAAVSEVVRLAEQMTLKTAFAGLPAGGGKAVLIDRPGLVLAPVYERLGQAIEQLGGSFVTGPDVGTSTAELEALAHTCRYVLTGGARLAASAAYGVVAACRVALDFLGAPLTSRALVSGVGAVGSLVARGLAEHGGELVIVDLDARRASEVASELGARVMTAEEADHTDAFLYAPCAVGPVVTQRNVGDLRVRVICGSSNQQLEDEMLAHALAAAGVLYVPDFAVNAGAVIEGVLRTITPPEGDVGAVVRAAVEAIGPRIRELLETARQADMTPLEAALMNL